jgi:hypothetical protein
VCAGIVEEPLMHDPSVFAEEIPQVRIIPNDARGRGCVGGERTSERPFTLSQSGRPCSDQFVLALVWGERPGDGLRVRPGVD